MAATVRLVLSPKDRELILQHGYPFEELMKVLQAAKDSNEPVSIEIEEFWFQHLLGELARSINHGANSALTLQLDDLYEYLACEGRACGLNVY